MGTPPKLPVPYAIECRARARASSYAARAWSGGDDARAVGTQVLGMTLQELSAVFPRSPIKRPKLPGMQRNTAVGLGNVATVQDVDVLTRALDGAEPPVRAHATWALASIRDRPR